MRTLSSRLIALVVVFVATVALVLIAFSYTRMRAEVLSALDREVDQAATLHAAKIGTWLESKRRLIGAAAVAAASETESLRPMLLRTKLAGDFSYCYMGFPDKRLIHGDDATVPPGSMQPCAPGTSWRSRRGRRRSPLHS